MSNAIDESVRRQTAIVRAIADELVRCLREGGDARTLREQFVEELAKLGDAQLEPFDIPEVYGY
jgi:hypothetical protein